MTDNKNTCFVCLENVNVKESRINVAVTMKVCLSCSGTEKEKQREKELLESLAEDFVCGCI